MMCCVCTCYSARTARVHKTQILDRSAYQFFNGVQLDGTDSWTSDSTIAEPIWYVTVSDV